MKDKIDLKALRQELRGVIREFYPYFLGFYLLALFVSIFSTTWHSFFYWPAFTGAIIFFTLLFALTFKYRDRLSFKHRLSFKRINFGRVTKYLRLILKLILKFIQAKLARLTRKDWLKIALIAAILIFALVKNIAVVDFLVLAYALAAFFYILESRISAGAALVLLASCPLFLILKKDAWAETAAIYAYYFLVITVAVQIRELKKHKNEDK